MTMPIYSDADDPVHGPPFAGPLSNPLAMKSGDKVYDPKTDYKGDAIERGNKVTPRDLIDSDKGLTISQEGLPLVNETVLLWVTEPYLRPTNTKKAFIFRVIRDDKTVLEIPWPEGMTVAESLMLWQMAAVKEHFSCEHKRSTSHWSDCDKCYDYHEDGHEEVAPEEPIENSDFRHLG